MRRMAASANTYLLDLCALQLVHDARANSRAFQLEGGPVLGALQRSIRITYFCGTLVEECSSQQAKHRVVW